MRRATLALVVLLLALAPVAGVGAAGATAGPSHTTDAVSANVAAQEDNATTTPTATPTNATEQPSTPTGGPASADTVRILPVQLEADFVSVTTVNQSETYNTSGPFAFFSFSEPVDEAAVQQDGAKATVLEGGNVVRIEYEADAAPVGKQSLYSVQIWYEDGSTGSLDLYASETSVTVGAGQIRQYRPVVLEMLEDAEDAGYERNPDGLESHYNDVQETAQLLDSLFTEQAKRLIGSFIGIVANPLGIATLLVLAALIALWQLRRNGESLEIISNDSGKAARLRERLWIQYRDQQQTAADESLRELKGIGEMGEIYWQDAFGVDTTAGLAELFRTGIPVRRNGEVRHVGGVENLDADTIDSSWIEAVCRDQRLPSAEIALSHGKTALQRMITKYGMAHHYQESFDDVREILEDLDESRDVSRHSATSSGTFGTGGSAAGGDD